MDTKDRTLIKQITEIRQRSWKLRCCCTNKRHEIYLRQEWAGEGVWEAPATLSKSRDNQELTNGNYNATEQSGAHTPIKRNRIRQQHSLLRKCRRSMITGPVKTDFLTLRLLLLEMLTPVGIPYFIWYILCTNK